MGRGSQTLVNRILVYVTSCFPNVRLHVAFDAVPMLPSFVKDSLPSLQSSFIVYKFENQCEADYVERTKYTLETRIEQQVPTSIRRGVANSSARLNQMACESAIRQHLIGESECSIKYTDTAFIILCGPQLVRHL